MNHHSRCSFGVNRHVDDCTPSNQTGRSQLKLCGITLTLIATLVASHQARADEGDILWRFGTTTGGVSLDDDRIGQLTATTPAIGSDGLLYVLADDLRLRALDSAGSSSVEWVSDMDTDAYYWLGSDPVNSPAVDASGTIWVGGITNSTTFCIYALNPSNGNITWNYELSGTKQFVGAPAIDNSQFVYVPLEDCIVGISPTGSPYAVRWAYYNDTSPNKYRTRFGIALSEDWVASGVTNQYLYFPEHLLSGTTVVGGRLHALQVYSSSSTAGYTNEWTWDFPADSPYTDEHAVNAPAVASDGTVYIGSSAGILYAIDPFDSTNRVEWTSSLGATMSSAVIAADNTIYVGTSDGYLRAIDPVAGTNVWSFYATNSVSATPLIGADGAVYIATTGGEFFCLNADPAASSRVLWSTNVATGGVDGPSLTMDGSGRVFALLNGVTTNQVVALEGFGQPGMTPWPMHNRNNRRSGKYRPPYLLTDLGSFNGYGDVIYASWVNNSGVVTGAGNDSSVGYDRAQTWYNGSFTALGTDTGYSEDYSALSVNTDGTVTGTAWRTISSFTYRAGYRHTYGGTWSILGPIYEYDTTYHIGYTDPIAINDDGIVAGKSMNSSGIFHAARWNSGSTSAVDLNTLAGNNSSRYSYCSDINQDGYIVGGSETGYTGNPKHGYLVSSNEVISATKDLGTPSNDDEDESYATGINDLGIISMYAPTNSFSQWRAFFKLPSSTSGGIEHTKDEDFVQVGAPSSSYQYLYDINNLNQATGYNSSSGLSIVPLHLNYMAPLSDLVALPSGWALSSLEHINDKGVIAGSYYSGSTVKGIILTPQD